MNAENTDIGFQWWVIWGWFGLCAGNLYAVFIVKDMPGIALILIIVNTTLMVMILHFNKYAFLVATVLSLNPVVWIVNGLYLKHRWHHPRVNGLQSSSTEEPSESNQPFNEITPKDRGSELVASLTPTKTSMPTFETTFEAIDRSVQQIFVRWEIYTQLFDSGGENVALLNASGSYVFFLLQRLLLDDTILALSRLTDPPTTGKHENASIRHLIGLVRSSLTPADANEVDVSLGNLERHVHNARTHRDKAIVHPDLQHAVGSSSLPDISYTELEGAMQELQKLMLRLGSGSIRRVGGYRPIIAFGTDGNALLKHLRKAKAL